jgi:hypothetical protein
MYMARLRNLLTRRNALDARPLIQAIDHFGGGVGGRKSKQVRSFVARCEAAVCEKVCDVIGDGRAGGGRNVSCHPPTGTD